MSKSNTNENSSPLFPVLQPISIEQLSSHRWNRLNKQANKAQTQTKVETNISNQPTPTKSNDPFSVLDKFVNPAAPSSPAPIQFPIDEALNSKLIIFTGDICKLQIEIIVNTTNERLNDHAGISGRILHYGGQQLVKACSNTDGCATGDAVLTNGFNLFAKHCIHTVGNEK
jgi:hypothetical protein